MHNSTHFPNLQVSTREYPSYNFSLYALSAKYNFFLFFFLNFITEEGKKLHFVSPARRKSVLAPILNKIKNVNDADGEKKSTLDGHVTVQIESAKKVKVS